jgi:phenylpropionate dioxygenase-like ring-hydroxylating dioxygenase large terminal subunit
VVLRDEQGEIRAFYNVCQHRGNRIFTNESGSVRQVACPYHGWRYALDGALVEVPDEERFCPTVDKSQRSLKAGATGALGWHCVDQYGRECGAIAALPGYDHG